MILALVRRHPVYEPALWVTTPIAVALGLLTGTLLRHDPAAQVLVPTFFLHCGVISWVGGITWSLRKTDMQQDVLEWLTRRAGEYEMSLPIAPRSLWLSHVLALLAAAFMPLLLFAAAMVTVAGSHHARAIGGSVLAYGCSTLLAVLLLQTLDPLRSRVRRGLVFYVLLAAAGLTTLGAVKRWLPWWSILLVAFLTALVTWRKLPTTFEMVPDTVPAPVRSSESRHRRWPNLLARFFYLRRFFLPRSAILFLLVGPALLGFGGSVTPAEQNLQHALFLFAPFLGLGCMGLGLLSFRHVAYLPLSRRELFAWLTLPSLLIFLASIALFAAHLGYGPRTPLEVGLDRTRSGLALRVPLSEWKVVVSSQAPEFTSPDGESFRPRSRHPLGLDRVTIYQPWEIGPESSPEFIAWRLSEAARAVYGVSVDPAEFSSGLTTDAAGEVRIAMRSFPLRGDYPSWVRPGRARRYAALVAGLVLAWCGTVIVIVSLARTPPGSRRRWWWWKIRTLTCWFAYIYGFVGLSLLFSFGNLSSEFAAAPLLAIGLASLADLFPLHPLLAWLVTTLICCACYALAEWRFSLIEPIHKKVLNP